ncbi:hypothetical protein [Profundibacter sp.]
MTFPTDITRVSIATDGTEGEWGSEGSSISGDGRYVTFETASTNLVAGDANDRGDVFVHDRDTGETRRVSVATDGTEGNQRSSTGSISEDGRYVAFQSGSTNFESTFPNSYSDIFVHDLQTGETELITVPMAGAIYVNGHSSVPDISADGRYVTYYSPAFSLVPGDTINTGDIYVYDRQLGITTRINERADGDGSSSVARYPAISDSGGHVAFETAASDLTVGDTNGQFDIFVRNLDTEVTERISVASDGTQGDGASQQASISDDGRYVAFRSYATNLVDGDTNGRTDIFLHDRVTGITTRISVAADGTEGNGTSDNPNISADGRYVTFSSDSSNLVAEDTSVERDIFVYDHLTGMIQRASVASDGSEANNRSTQASISADGSVITFTSLASNLVAGDTNTHDDVFTVSNPLLSNDNANILHGTEGDDTFFGLGGDDTIAGLAGNDRLDGGDGDDALNGGDGQDTLIGGAGDDTLIGGASLDDLRDTIYGGAGNDTIDGGYGNDELRGDAGNDTIAGGFGADRVIGGTGDDVLTGSALGDELFGGDGSDFVNGGWGHDRVNGGADGDRFFHIGIFDHGSDWIQDYVATDGDVLVFGITTATAADFQVNLAHTSDSEGERSGDDAVEEAFIIYRPTGQIMWALVDGGGQAEINISIGGEVFDLLG